MYNTDENTENRGMENGRKRRTRGFLSGWMLLVKARNEPTNTNISSFSGSRVTGMLSRFYAAHFKPLCIFSLSTRQCEWRAVFRSLVERYFRKIAFEILCRRSLRTKIRNRRINIKFSSYDCLQKRLTTQNYVRCKKNSNSFIS